MPLFSEQFIWEDVNIQILHSHVFMGTSSWFDREFYNKDMAWKAHFNTDYVMFVNYFICFEYLLKYSVGKAWCPFAIALGSNCLSS